MRGRNIKIGGLRLIKGFRGAVLYSVCAQRLEDIGLNKRIIKYKRNDRGIMTARAKEIVSPNGEERSR